MVASREDRGDPVGTSWRKTKKGPERRFEMDDSSGINRRVRRNWKTWLGVGLALAVVAVLVVLIAANSGGGSGGLY
jgi:Flp pilus assembly protein TadB